MTPTYKLSGDAELTSHFVYQGISQTNKNPGLLGSFWFNFGPQFRLGVWAANTNYEGSSSHLWLKLNSDIKINFSTDVDLVLTYSQNQFYSPETRNGNTIQFNLNLMSYHVIYQIQSNWEGTQSGATSFAFQKSMKIFTSWDWDNRLGYTQVKSSDHSSYFDLKTGLGTPIKDIFFEGSLTGTSNTRQLDGRGAYFIALNIRASF